MYKAFGKLFNRIHHIRNFVIFVMEEINYSACNNRAERRNQGNQNKVQDCNKNADFKFFFSLCNEPS